MKRGSMRTWAWAIAVAGAGFGLQLFAQSPVQMMDACNSRYGAGHWHWSADGSYGSCDTSTGSGAAATLSTSQLEATMQNAFTNLFRSIAANAQRKQQMQLQLRQALPARRDQLIRQNQLAQAQQLDAMMQRLDGELKLNGSGGDLSLKLGDNGDNGGESGGGQGYGICGLPGLATGGERAGCGSPSTASQDGGGDGLKLGSAATADESTPAPSAPAASNGADQIVSMFLKMAPAQQEKVLEALDATPAAAAAPTPVLPPPAPVPPAVTAPAPTPVPPSSSSPVCASDACLGLHNPLRDQADVENALVLAKSGDQGWLLDRGVVIENFLRESYPALADRYLADSTFAAAVNRDLGAQLDQIGANQNRLILAAVQPAPGAPAGLDHTTARAQQADAVRTIETQALASMRAAAVAVAQQDAAIAAPADSDVLYLFQPHAASGPAAPGPAPTTAFASSDPMTIMAQQMRSDVRRQDLEIYAPAVALRYEQDPAFARQLDAQLDATTLKLDAQYDGAVVQARRSAMAQMGQALDTLRASGTLRAGVPLAQQEAADPALRSAVEAARQRILAAESAAENQAADALTSGLTAAFQQAGAPPR